MTTPAAQTEHFKAMLESAARLAAKQTHPPLPGAAPGAILIKDDGVTARVHDYAWHVANEAERRRIGPDGKGSRRVPVFRGIPRVVWREMRYKIRRAVRKSGQTFSLEDAQKMADQTAAGAIGG